MKNRNKKIARVCFLLGLVFLGGAFSPGLLAIEGMDGGFAIILISGFLSLMLFISAAMYNRLARQIEKVLRPENQLVKWSYSETLWAAYVGEDYKQDKKGKMTVFWIITGFALFFGLLFLILDPDAGKYVALIMLGLILIVFVAARMAIRAQRKRNLEGGRTALISTVGVIVGGNSHAWGTLGATLDSGQLVEEGELMLIVLEYSYPVRHGRGSTQVRIPVPPGQESEAEAVLMRLSETVKKN